MQAVRPQVASPKTGKAPAVRQLHKPLLEHGPQEPEEWRPVPGFESTYIASDLGRVARMIGSRGVGKYWTTFMPRKIEGHGCSMGSAQTKRGRRGFRVYIHHIIALTFIGKPTKDKPIINHIDGNKENNRPSNLEWCDQGHNVRHYLTLKAKRRRGRSLNGEEIMWIREQYKSGRSMNSIAKEMNMHPTSVSYQVKGKCNG